MAVYAYFGMTLVGSQILMSTEENPRVDIYFPIFVVFKLILLIGWLKVANCIEKPFGTDDTDFQARAKHFTLKHSYADDICSSNLNQNCEIGWPCRCTTSWPGTLGPSPL